MTTQNLLIHSQSAISHLLEHKPEAILSLSVNGPESAISDRVRDLVKKAKAIGLKVTPQPKSPKDAESLTAVVRPFEYTEWAPWLASLTDKKNALVLALDHIQDPQNLGALCRTAEALGVDGVLIPKDRGAVVSSGAYHASAGAVETLPIIQVVNLNEALRKMKEAGFWIVGAALEDGSKSIEETPSFEKKVLVVGTELKGLSPLTLKTCDWLVEIPIVGKVQSLNVSNAGAILMYEFSKTKPL